MHHDTHLAAAFFLDSETETGSSTTYGENGCFLFFGVFLARQKSRGKLFLLKVDRFTRQRTRSNSRPFVQQQFWQSSSARRTIMHGPTHLSCIVPNTTTVCLSAKRLVPDLPRRKREVCNQPLRSTSSTASTEKNLLATATVRNYSSTAKKNISLYARNDTLATRGANEQKHTHTHFTSLLYME